MIFLFALTAFILFSALGIGKIPYIIESHNSAGVLPGAMFWSGLFLAYLIFIIKWSTLRNKNEFKDFNYKIPILRRYSGLSVLIILIAVFTVMYIKGGSYSALFYVSAFIYIWGNVLFLYSRKTVIYILKGRRSKYEERKKTI